MRGHMRKTSKIWSFFILSAILLILLSPPVNAREVFLYLGFSEIGKVYRVVTDYEMRRPVGYFFDATPVEAFYVDKFKDFRMLRLGEEHEQGMIDMKLSRQVFDGSIADADLGNGTLQHDDQREVLIKGSKAVPVYRSPGAPLSCNTGKKIPYTPDLKEFCPGEVKVFSGKKWYEIPNGSWYQTWNTIAEPKGSSYLIFYDQWNRFTAEVVESFWRGEKPGLVMEEKSGAIEKRKLLRATINGAMEVIAEFDRPVVVAENREKFSWYFDPGDSLGKGNLVFYSWFGAKAGKMTINGEQSSFKIQDESRCDKIRFPWAGAGRGLVVGCDVVEKWLKKSGNENSQRIDCTLASFYVAKAMNSLSVAVYSSNNSSLYEFRFEQMKLGSPSLIRKTELMFTPDALFYDMGGNLLMAAHEQEENTFFPDLEPGYGVETIRFDSSTSPGGFSDSGEKLVNPVVPAKLSGKIVFSKGFRESVYVLERDEPSVKFLNSVRLNKEYFYREFKLNNPPQDVFSTGYAEILLLARKPGNSLSKLQKNAPGFPDEHVKPEKVFLGFFQE